MGDMRHKFPAILVLLALSGCATLPSGPSVMVLPDPGKPFEVFQSEDAVCRRWAEQQVGSNPQEAYQDSAITGAAVGTALGAGIGALFGAAAGNPAAGAAIGGGSGLLMGSAVGASNGESYGYSAQNRYDNAYVQCMYASGNQIPGSSARRSYRRSYVAPPPPPPPVYQAAPEGWGGY
jgi:hypothetical protein